MSEKERDRAFLAELQALPTNDKIMRSIGLIGEWNKHFGGKVYPKKIWVPSKKGLGMGKVFEMLCEIYGKDFIEW